MDEGVPLPPCDWAVEPHSLGPGVMAACTVFSDSQTQLSARVLNNSLKPKTLQMSLLSMAEPVQCLFGTADELDNLSQCDGDSLNVPVHPDELSMPVSSSLRPATVQTDATGLRTSTVTTPTAEVTGSDSSNPAGSQHDHILGLLCMLPADLTAKQHAHAETSIRSWSNVFSRSEYDIGRTSIIPHRIDTGDHSPHFEQLRCHPTTQLPVIDEHVMTSLSRQHHRGAPMW